MGTTQAISLRDAVSKLVSYQHQIAVLEELIDHLESNFLPSDYASAAETLMVEDCMVPTVSVEAIEAVHTTLVEARKILEKTMNALEGTAVEIEDGEFEKGEADSE